MGALPRRFELFLLVYSTFSVSSKIHSSKMWFVKRTVVSSSVSVELMLKLSLHADEEISIELSIAPVERRRSIDVCIFPELLTDLGDEVLERGVVGESVGGLF